MPRLLEAGHEIISGTIGMGKSFWVLYKIVKSLVFDRPCCYIDPKGDTYRNLLTFFSSTRQGQELWETYRHRILLVNPVSPSDWLVSFNAIEPIGEFRHASVDPVALLANSLDRAVQVAEAMEARAFGNGKKRVFYKEVNITKTDAAALGVAVLPLAAGIIFRVMGFGDYQYPAFVFNLLVFRFHRVIDQSEHSGAFFDDTEIIP